MYNRRTNNNNTRPNFYDDDMESGTKGRKSNKNRSDDIMEDHLDKETQ